MLKASIIVHGLFGALLAGVFVLYYINSDGKWKVLTECLIGGGGNAGAIFLLDKLFQYDDVTIRMYGVSSCLAAFIVMTGLLLLLVSFLIKDKDDKNIIRIRDILLGQTAWINKYYESRAKEIETRLNIAALEAREADVAKLEYDLNAREQLVAKEFEKLNEAGKSKLRLKLPENKKLVLKRDLLEAMPSYITDMVKCINDIDSCTNSLLSKAPNEVNITELKSYFASVATYISWDLFGGATRDVRIHFRMYDVEKDGYAKLVAVIGNTILGQELTFIPRSQDNMINRSFECRRALIKSINSGHDYRSNNHTIWQDYLTYTFHGISHMQHPVLSFGISVKNTARYENILYSLNYFRLENFLQENIERVNGHVNISSILYGGVENGTN